MLKTFEWLELERRLESGWSTEVLRVGDFQRVNDENLKAICLVGFTPDEYPLLLVPMGANDVEVPKTSSNVMDVRVVSKEIDAIDTRYFAQVMCKDLSLTSVFKELVFQFIQGCHDSELDPVSVFVNLVDDWKRFLSEKSSRTKRSTIIGLFGELQVLQMLASYDAQRALDAWEGPRGHLHDFVTESIDIEVKSTSHTKSRVLHLDGLQQMKAIAQSGLVLANLRIVPHASGSSIRELVDDLVAAGVDRKKIMKKVELVISSNELEELDDTKYVAISRDFYTVDDKFPRVDVVDETGNFPSGVLNVSIDIDLTVATRLLPEEVSEKFRSAVSAGSEV